MEKGDRVRMPVEVRCIFRCEGEESCRGHKIFLLDWEFNETVRNLIREEQEALSVEKKIRKHFFNLMQEKELYFILGTHYMYGTWMITGLFYPEKNDKKQKSLSGF